MTNDPIRERAEKVFQEQAKATLTMEDPISPIEQALREVSEKGRVEIEDLKKRNERLLAAIRYVSLEFIGHPDAEEIIDEARDEALEEAAKRVISEQGTNYTDIANDIRALKQGKEGK